MKKVTHLWSILCAGSSLDKESNNLTLYNVIEQLTISRPKTVAENTPIQLPLYMELITTWKKIFPEDFVESEIKIDIVAPNGKILSEINYNFEIPKDKQRHRQITKMSGFAVTDAGEYLFRIHARETKKDNFVSVGEVPLLVVVNP
jgi:hypothetical protein